MAQHPADMLKKVKCLFGLMRYIGLNLVCGYIYVLCRMQS